MHFFETIFCITKSNFPKAVYIHIYIYIVNLKIIPIYIDINRDNK